MIQNGTKCKPKCTYIRIYLSIYKYLTTNNHAKRYNKTHIYVFKCYMHLNICMYGCIQPYILIYALFWHVRGARDQFIVNSQPGSWCELHRYNAALPNFPEEGYRTNRATQTLGQQTEPSSIQVTRHVRVSLACRQKTVKIEV